MENNRNTSFLAASVLVAALLPFCLYIGGYFYLCTHDGYVKNLPELGRVRAYDHLWQARLFMPASAIHSAIRGEQTTNIAVDK